MKCLYEHKLETVQMQQYLNLDNIVSAVLDYSVIILFIFKIIR